MRWPCWLQVLLWVNNKVRREPGYEANDVDMLGMQIKFDATCWFLRSIRPAAVDPKQKFLMISLPLSFRRRLRTQTRNESPQQANQTHLAEL